MSPDPSRRLLDAMLAQVPFDGWSERALAQAGQALGLDRGQVAALAPRGAVGLAALHHREGDARMVAALAARDLGAMRFRDRVALAVRLRIEPEDREITRRSAALFALPGHLAEGGRLTWGTADAIWRALGDSSQDANWYSKRLTLSGVLSSVLLYWLGDTSEGSAESWAFLDRRIEGVMRFEKVKAGLRRVPVLGRLMGSRLNPLSHLRAPSACHQGWPGYTGATPEGGASEEGAPPDQPQASTDAGAEAGAAAAERPSPSAPGAGA